MGRQTLQMAVGSGHRRTRGCSRWPGWPHSPRPKTTGQGEGEKSAAIYEPHSRRLPSLHHRA